MNMLAELTTSNITKEEHPETMSEHARVAERGGSVAKVAKEAFEKQTGKKVVSSMSMKRYIESQQPKLELGTGEDADNDGQYSENRGNYSRGRDSYRGYSRDGYSRHTAKERMIEKLEGMADKATSEKDRQAIMDCIEELDK